MSAARLTIGALSAQTDCNVPTIRYYEDIGLLPHAARASNGHRYYGEADLKRLTFIKRCRDFGFSIEQVRELVDLFENGDRSCTEVRDMAQVHLDAVRVKLEELRQLETSLTVFVDSCNEACSDGATRNCVIIGNLSASGACSAGPSTNANTEKVNATEVKRPRSN